MRGYLLILILLALGGALADEPAKPAHDDQRAEAEAGFAEGYGAFLAFGYRFGLHDLLDPVRGYPVNTDFEVLHLKIRQPLAHGHFWLDDFTLFRIASLSPTELSLPERSWEVEMGARTERSQLCDHCVAGHLLGGLGATFQVSRAWPLEFFLMGDIGVSYGPGYAGFPLKPGIGPHGGLRWRVSPALIALFDGHYAYTFPADSPHVYDFGTDWRFSPARDVAVSARLRRYPDAWEMASSLLFYF